MLIEDNTIATAWEKSIHAVIRTGEWIPAERGNRVKEIRNVLFTINSPETEPLISTKYNFSTEFLFDYAKNYLLALKSTDTVAERVTSYGETNLNQLDKITEILANHYYSRRAVIATWIPQIDLYSSHPPCVTSLQFLIRNSSLEITAMLRSNDAWFAALPDLISIYYTQSKIANALNLKVGKLHMLSTSYHIYEMDLFKATEMFSNLQ